MSFYELICFTKVYNAAFGFAPRTSVSKEEINITFEVLKKMADNRLGWSQEQKEIYKLLVDFVKSGIEGN